MYSSQQISKHLKELDIMKKIASVEAFHLSGPDGGGAASRLLLLMLITLG